MLSCRGQARPGTEGTAVVGSTGGNARGSCCPTGQGLSALLSTACARLSRPGRQRGKPWFVNTCPDGDLSFPSESSPSEQHALSCSRGSTVRGPACVTALPLMLFTGCLPRPGSTAVCSERLWLGLYGDASAPTRSGPVSLPWPSFARSAQETLWEAPGDGLGVAPWFFPLL